MATTPVRSPVGAPLQGSLVAGGSGAMFDGIAGRYDLMNRLMTFGIDQRWRRQTVDLLDLRGEGRLLDLATGTADLALMAARRLPQVRVVGLDPSANMLSVGQAKVRKAGLQERVELVLGDACQLPFDDASFDGITMGYGIRNVTDRPRALREMSRVLRPGAKLCILETGEPSGPLGLAARLHMRVLVPAMGRLFSGAPAEYRYLQQSTAAFPRPERFAEIMEGSGLRVLRVVTLLAGASHIYVATPSQA